MKAEWQALRDRAAVSEVILRFARSLDTQDWAMCRSCFVDEIETDYSDLRGEPPAIVKADDFVSKRRTALRALKTLHVSSNHLITVEGDEAHCQSNAVIYRCAPDVEEDNSFDTYGAYSHHLRRTSEGWKIYRVKQTVYWNTGNPRVHGAWQG